MVLESDLPLPELAPAGEAEPESRFRILPVLEAAPAPCPFFHRWLLPDGRLWLGFARQRSGYLLRFPDLADFLLSPGGDEIRCHPASGAAPDTIRHLLLDQVIPLVLSQRDRLVLHASGVLVSGRGIAFLGVTGQGKSTLAASFSQQGFPLLTDDCLSVEDAGEGLFLVPSYPGLRLWPKVIAELFGAEPVLGPVAHYSGKKRLGFESGSVRFCSAPVPLRRLYLLAPPSGTGRTGTASLTPLSPRDTFIELVKYAYCLDVRDGERLQSRFRLFARVAEAGPVLRLSYPRDLSLLPAVREAILADLESGP